MIEAKGIKRSFGEGDLELEVLKGIDLNVKKGEFVAIMGRSGAGKSTLLYQLGLLDTPTAGSIKLEGKNTQKFTEREKTQFRLTELGFIFQDYAIIPELTATENVVLPLIMKGMSHADAVKKAHKALKRMDLSNQLNNLPSQLSGGEQQRVSIARAIAHEPKILFADEPTANLDSVTAKVVIELINSLNEDDGQTVVMVTHEIMYGKYADRIIELDDGTIISEKKTHKK